MHSCAVVALPPACAVKCLLLEDDDTVLSGNSPWTIDAQDRDFHHRTLSKHNTANRL